MPKVQGRTVVKLGGTYVVIQYKIKLEAITDVLRCLSGTNYAKTAILSMAKWSGLHLLFKRSRIC